MKQYNSSIKGKLFNYFKQRLNIKKSTKGWWRTDCVYCGGKFSMGIHLEQTRVHCFKCTEKVSPIDLLMELEGFETYSQVAQFLSIQQEYEYYESNTVLKREYKKVELPEHFTLLSQGTTQIARSARGYMKNRGFDIDNLSLKGIGYCDEGEYFGYIIFPYYRKGELIYYQGRLFLGDGPKMKNPPDEKFGIGKSQVVFNLDAFYMYNKVYLLESITNCLTMGDNAGAISGKTISSHQMSNIIMAPFNNLVIILDPDAYVEALELGMQMVNHKKVKVVKLKGKVDVNDIGRDRTIRFIKRTPWQKYMDLYKIRMNEKGAKYRHNGRGPNYIDKK